MNNNWERCYKLGKIAEKDFCNFFLSYGYNVMFSPDNIYYPWFDLLISKEGEKDRTVEVKYQESILPVTEFKCVYNGKWCDSGIDITIAKLWAESLKDPKTNIIQYFLTNIEILKRAIKEKLYIKIREGGDENHRTLLYMWEREIYKKLFKEIQIPKGKFNIN